MKTGSSAMASVGNNFISACENLPEIISKLSQKFIAAFEYFPNMFSVAETISAAEIILFQFQSWLHVK